jgi:curved DNA-binding protein CbpA
VPRSLYDVLGVPVGATDAQLRQAYRDKASRLHPDRWVDASAAERSASASSMREVNEAWRILGDPESRRSYDRSMAGPARLARNGNDLDDRPMSDPVARLVRALPWLLLMALLAAIFVFTAYARS